jgi:hypothetical protein
MTAAPLPANMHNRSSTNNRAGAPPFAAPASAELRIAPLRAAATGSGAAVARPGELVDGDQHDKTDRRSTPHARPILKSL